MLDAAAVRKAPEISDRAVSVHALTSTRSLLQCSRLQSRITGHLLPEPGDVRRNCRAGIGAVLQPRDMRVQLPHVRPQGGAASTARLVGGRRLLQAPLQLRHLCYSPKQLQDGQTLP